MNPPACDTSDFSEPLAAFRSQVAELTKSLTGRTLDAGLADELNRDHPPGSPVYDALFAACRRGVAEGWICQREGGGIRYGRVCKAGPDLHGFSVDVVDMADIVGPHHVHPLGEIDLVMPLSESATFDGQPAGWKVYGPGSAHCPTVRDGRALVLYLLPKGAIEFTPTP